MNTSAFYFYLGSFISSLGSQTFMVGLIVFTKIAGYPLWQMGLLLASMKAAQIIITLVYGEAADRVSPKRIVIVTEFAAGLIALGLIYVWTKGPSYFGWLLVLVTLRSSILAVQSPSKNKISKGIGEPTFESQSRNAIWLNKVNQGTIFFASGLGWVAVKWLSFPAILLFDACTYFINGLLIVTKFDMKNNSVVLMTKRNILSKFHDLYHFNPRAALFDILLALSMCGGNLFLVRFSGNDDSWIPIYLASFGLAVWTTGFLYRIKWIANLHGVLWAGLGLSFWLLATHPGAGLITLLCFVLNDSFYWMLYHRYSSFIQHETPMELMAAVSSARTTQSLIVLGLGEWLVGVWSPWVSVYWEGLWRAFFCTSVIIFALLFKTSKT